MAINRVGNRLYKKVFNECTYVKKFPEVSRTLHSKDGLRRITQTVYPNGDYNMEVWQGNDIIKMVEKRVHPDGAKLNTWDYLKSKGRIIKNVFTSGCKSFEQRVFDKSAPFENASGFRTKQYSVKKATEVQK